MFGNVFTGESFSNLEMTAAINKMQYVESQIAQIIPFQESTSLTPDVAIDQERGLVRVLPTSPRGGEAPAAQNVRRTTAKIEIPGYAERDTILNSSLLGVRETGSLAYKTLEGERDKRLQAMLSDHQHTLGYQRCKALDGKILDADGSLLVDLFALLGEEQLTMDLDLTSSSADVADQIVLMKEACEDELGAFSADNYVLIQGRNDSHATLKTKVVKEAATDPMSFWLNHQDNRKGVRIADNVNIVSVGRARHNGNGFIDDNSSYLVPVFDGCARTIYGPSEVEEFWGNPLPYYVTRELLKHGKGVEIETWSYVINFFTRPRSIIKVNVIA